MNIAFNTDCMEVMKQYPDQYFDLAVVDPPYGDGGGAFSRGTRFGGKFDRYKGIDRTGRTWAKGYGKKIIEWDVAPGAEYFEELFRVSKEQVIWGGQLLRTATQPVLFDLGETQHSGKLFHGYG